MIQEKNKKIESCRFRNSSRHMLARSQSSRVKTLKAQTSTRSLQGRSKVRERVGREGKSELVLDSYHVKRNNKERCHDRGEGPKQPAEDGGVL